MSFHFVIDPRSVRPRRVGPSIGVIWLEFDDTAFPAPHWTDFVVVILEAWVAAMLRIARGSSTFERVHFMEGPYHVEIRQAASRRLQLRAVERPRTEMASAEVSTDILLVDLSRAADAVIAAARAGGDATVDLDRLQHGLDDVRREIIKLRNEPN